MTSRISRNGVIVSVAVTLTMVFGLGDTPASGAPPDTIRVGGPSAPTDPKLAIVASRRSLAGRGFTVSGASGGVVLRGRLRRAPGSSAPWRRAAIADLSAVTAPGSYRVRVGTLRSKPWQVDSAAAGTMLARLMRIYDANSDGAEPSSLFGPAHLNDAVIKGGPYDGQQFDLTGGWRDAGDNLKFVQTTGFAVAYLHYAARLAPSQAGTLLPRSDVGVRWLIRAHPRPDLFVAQIGDLSDHEGGFRDPSTDDSGTVPGQQVRKAYTSTGGTGAGLAAAGLALSSGRFEGDVRDAILGSAREWYAAGKASGKPTFAPGDAYRDETVADNMALGAAALWRATGEASYLDDAVAFLRKADFQGGLDPFEVGPLAAADLCGALGAPAAPDPEAQRVACAGLRTAGAAARDRYRVTAFGTPAGFSFGSIQDIGGSGTMAVVAARAGLLKGGLAIGAGARDYTLGRNPWGASFVVGPARKEAANPHHGSYLRGDPRQVLNGAVVGGPTSPAALKGRELKLARRGRYRRFNSKLSVYEDRRENYITSEVSLTYSASTLLLTAALTPPGD